MNYWNEVAWCSQPAANLSEVVGLPGSTQLAKAVLGCLRSASLIWRDSASPDR